MISFLRIRLLSLLFLLFLAGGVSAQSLDLDQLLTEAEITGMSIAVIEDGRISQLLNAGVRSSETQPPITDETVFEAESLSKSVVAWIALRLIDEGTLDLDQSLAQLSPWEDAAHDSRYEQITTRMVLSHTSGFPNFRVPGEPLPLLFDPGAFYTYSGEGFLFLQHVLEAITYSSLEDLAREYVFEPFGMTSSSFVWQNDYGSRIAVGHTDMDVPLDKFVPQQANAALSLHTTASDYARFVLGVIEGEDLGRRQYREMMVAQVDALDGIFWGLGWGLQPTINGSALWEWGDNAGYKSFAWLAPDASKGFVMLSNSANGMLVLHELFEAFVGGPQTSVRWLNYERYDDAVYQLSRRLQYAQQNGGIEAVRTDYEVAKSEMPAEAFVETALNALGYRLLRRGAIEESIEVFRFNTELYPRSGNVFDSLAEALLASGDMQAALDNYETSVRLDPGNENGVGMIQVIEARLAAEEQ
ncbi:MAG: serine hydrolase [Bacteroidetes bacterium]|nr:serine hydrolase [Bacteroidota bacterium]MDA1334004.1 serine hydrolase [Bacteroidota bacterium]